MREPALPLTSFIGVDLAFGTLTEGYVVVPKALVV
jgi:hypothetical protein